MWCLFDCSCEAGYFSSEQGAQSSETCRACPAGTFSTVPGITTADQCTHCPRGTYSGNDAQSSDAACQKCPEGTYSQVGCTHVRTNGFTHSTGLHVCFDSAGAGRNIARRLRPVWRGQLVQHHGCHRLQALRQGNIFHQRGRGFRDHVHALPCRHLV